jgi:hypothetical protein
MSGYSEESKSSIRFFLSAVKPSATFLGGSPDVLGNNDIAEVFGIGSSAIAGANATTPGDLDLAAVFGGMLNALAAGGSNLVDILPSL